MKQIILVLAMLVAWAFPMHPVSGDSGLRGAVSSHLTAMFDSTPQGPGQEVELVIWPAGCPTDAVIVVVEPMPAGEDV